MRLNDKRIYTARAAAATAGTVQVYVMNGPTKFRFEGYSWMYESTEANADNTFDWVVAYTTDGSAFTTIVSNGNPIGLADTGVALLTYRNRKDPGAGGGAALASATPAAVEVPANAVLRFTLVTAGTGTIPAVQLQVDGLSY